MKGKRLKETAALVMVGDGVLTAISPKRHLMLWRTGPRWYRSTIDLLARHPRWTRGIGAAAAAFGVYWALQQKPEKRRWLSAVR